MMKYIYLLLVCFLFVQCKGHGTGEAKSDLSEARLDSAFEKYNIASLQYLNSYLNSRDKKRDKPLLDSSLCVIDSGLVHFPMRNLLRMRKLIVLAEQQNFNEAISYLRDYDIIYSNDTLYPYKEILMERLLAMKCLAEGDTVKGKEHLNKSLCIIEEYVERNKEEVSAFWDNNRASGGMLDKSTFIFATFQYYAVYKALYGKDAFVEKLNNDTVLGEGTRCFLDGYLEQDNLAFTGI